jgi:cell division protein FtsI (penicillin-binding protein 3)
MGAAEMNPIQRSRLRLLAVLVGLAALAIGVRLGHLQLVRAETLQEIASRQHRRTVEVSATRGAILDRDGRELAVSLATQALFAHPGRVDDPRGAARKLAPILGLTVREVEDRLRSDRPFVWLHRFLEPRQVETIRALGLPTGGSAPFGFLPSFRRYYPRGPLGVHVVGFADVDGRGLEGIERRFDDELRGEPSVYLVLQDGRSGGLRQLVRAPASRPQDLTLTIDLALQHVVERELEKAVRESGAVAGSAILLDPSTGEILALANRPTFDPNAYSTSRPDARTNRVLVHQYEPGSTFKVVPMAAALERGGVRPDQRFDCEQGQFNLGARRIRDTKPHGVLSAAEILAVSSNIGMVKIGQRLPPAVLHEYVSRFGFGVRTGIELPGEVAGSVRPLERWNEYTRTSLAFGQEIGVSVLQMASALATIANDGVRVPPHVVLGRIDAQGRTSRGAPARGERVIAERTARELTRMLERVIVEGTGGEAALEGYRLAGKSGTAQKSTEGGGYSETDFLSSFGGFGPLPEPRLVALVVLDSPRRSGHYGGQVAGPAFARIMRDALAHLRAPREGATIALRSARPSAMQPVAAREPRRPPAGRPRPEPVPNGSVPDLTGLGLREAIARLAASGCLPTVVGTGTVVAQHPPAGALPPGTVCRLELGEEPDVEPEATIEQAAVRGPRP